MAKTTRTAKSTEYPPSQGADTLSLKKALEKAQDMLERPNRAGN